MGKYSYTDILYAQPSFLSGMSRVLDIGGTFDSYNIKQTPQQADLAALKSDWVTIGNDIKYTINESLNKNE